MYVYYFACYVNLLITTFWTVPLKPHERFLTFLKITEDCRNFSRKTRKDLDQTPTNIKSNITLHYITVPPPGGGVLKKVIRECSALRSDPLPFYIPFFFSEKAPLSYTFHWKKAPLSYTFLRRLMNKSLKQEVFLSFFFQVAARLLAC